MFGKPLTPTIAALLALLVASAALADDSKPSDPKDRGLSGADALARTGVAGPAPSEDAAAQIAKQAGGKPLITPDSDKKPESKKDGQ